MHAKVTSEIPFAGSASNELQKEAQALWIQTAAKAGIDLTNFNPEAPLSERIRWAKSIRLPIATMLARFSSRLQHSTPAQTADNVIYAATHRMYLPPEYINIDEGVTGKKVKRDGIERLKVILANKFADVLLVFKISRLFRVGHRGYAFFQEELVEEGLRGISISQGIDTAEEKTWKLLCYMHGIADEMLLSTIADHVRSGLKDLFRKGFVVGAVGVGYGMKEIEGARPTNLGRPRKMPVVIPDVRDLINQHAEMLLAGRGIRRGWRKWVKAGGPKDPRSKSDHMTYGAYRRLFSNPRLTGRWAFGRMKNSWSSKRDILRQQERPEAEVTFVISEELRILSDETFAALQVRFDKLKLGPRGPKKIDVQLWDLVVDCFFCEECSLRGTPIRYYTANGHSMQCKHMDFCPCRTFLRREPAVRAVCEKLTELLQQDADLIEQVIVSAQELDAKDLNVSDDQVARLRRQILTLSNRADDLIELAGQGTDKDRASLKMKIRSTQFERTQHEAELAKLTDPARKRLAPITAEDVRAVLRDLTGLLMNAASENLDEEAVYRAVKIFKLLVGERIDVRVERRPGRKQVNVRGLFTPQVIAVVQSQLANNMATPAAANKEVCVWLRKPPKRDQWAERVHQLIDVEKESFRVAEKTLQKEGFIGNSGVVWQIHQRYWEMIGQPAPKVPYNNGAPRKGRS